MSRRSLPLTLALTALALVACGTDAPRDPLAPSAPSLKADRGAPATAARGAAVPFRGRLEASEETDFASMPGFALVDLRGTGTATHLGKYTLEGDFTVNTSTLAGAGTLTFTAANGDVLTATVVAQATPTPGFTGATVVETATITGGTGRFAGATGSFTITRALSFITGVSSGSFEGTITRSH
jgi:hypothetical protein